MSPMLLSGGLSIWLTCVYIWTFSGAMCHGIQPEPTQHWAYVNVREYAHMFYWLYESPTQGADVPLILWLQGGPGGSSTGFGNFEEIGPLDVDRKPRNTTWLSAASLLFVDNPVGTGFSYVESNDALTTNVSMIAEDMLVLLKSFFNESKWGIKYQKTPFYIFCESYGGKMTAAISQVLYQAIQTKALTCNFKGLALGDSWISPIDSMLNWGPYLHTNSIVDDQGLSRINTCTSKALDFIQSGEWTNATAQFSVCEGVVSENSGGVNFYNILDWGPDETQGKYFQHMRYSTGEEIKRRILSVLYTDKLSALMNGPIREKLKIIPPQVQWGGQSELVFQHMRADFMKPVVDIVNKLIEETDLRVVVYTGQLDLICCTPGTEKWMERLNIYPKFRTAKRTSIADPVTGFTSGFVKTYKNFSMYWILGAGHMAPKDNGDTVLAMVKKVTSTPAVHYNPYHKLFMDLEAWILKWTKKT